MKRVFVVLAGISFLIASFNASSATVCVDHYPPFQMVTGTNQAEGISIDFIKEVFARLGEPLIIVTRPSLQRCLKRLRAGRVDFIAGIYKTRDRSEYLDFYQYSDGYSETQFITMHAKKPLTSFEDLAGLRVGIIEQYGYFPKFDQENDLFTKVEAENLGQLIYMLTHEQIDYLVVSENQWKEVEKLLGDYNPAIKKAQYSYKNNIPVYLGLSKFSDWQGDRAQLQAIVLSLYNEQFFDKLRAKSGSQ